MENPQDQTSPTNENNVSEIPAIPETSNAKDPKKSKKPIIIVGVLLAIPLIVLVSLVSKEYLRASKFTGGVKKVQSSDYYKGYVKNIHTYLESNNGEYVNYRSCNVTSTDALWSFKQPEDAKYYYSDFSMIYNTLEGSLRGEQSDVKKNIPADYKKSTFSGVARGLDHSIQKRQQILDLTSSMEVLFNSNDYIDYCSRVIYQNVIDRVSFVEVNSNGTNTVINSATTIPDRDRVDALRKELEAAKVPSGFEAVHQSFVSTLKAISQTFTDITKQQNTTDSNKSNQAAFKKHEENLDKSLVELSKVAKQKISAQPNSVSERLKAVEQ